MFSNKTFIYCLTDQRNYTSSGPNIVIPSHSWAENISYSRFNTELKCACFAFWQDETPCLHFTENEPTSTSIIVFFQTAEGHRMEIYGQATLIPASERELT